ncbi:hypothetical protein LPH50_00180 [Xylella taiwanensis]|uniref:Uncharacterized protein n=2 Tax=Xylella taiwanensis TaxID=1444770 RepID=A0ABS8TZS5_9GAMM|nr:hypothetical protein [Xylella taiwanensis]MCD8456651.1 hypothetical protein [Xylella taiwanensis]MCD8456666.1 hypothetical protein [Xylella taiwanensis]MCD8459058.1 hypothetical protein [Xylella taiwanensis]MCD8459073.1 hypothetical protein [Xylella taiwanensis]MCD8461197.1 hypothetical protein [Xylella taiwanensis]
MDMPKVTIMSGVNMRVVTTSKGVQMQIYSQRAVLESELMKLQIDVDVDGLNAGYPVGAIKYWDVVTDLVPGQYGLGLARRMTLVDANVSSSGRAVPPVSASKVA